VSCIQFQPWLSGKMQNHIVAESFLENLSFDERVIFSMKSSKSCILFWNFEDLHSIDPILILSSPLEILCFEFNPKDPNIVVGGSINGQVVLWDLKNISLTSEPIKKQQSRKSEKSTL
jgi:WD40 repeat protein